MAEPIVFENCYVALTTSTGSSTYVELPGVKSVSMPISREDLDDSVMGDTSKASYPGRLDIPVDVTCRQDFTTAISATAGVDKLVYLRMINRTAVKLKIRPVDAAVSGPNPSYILTKVRFHAATPLDGKHGDALENKIKLMPQSTCTLVRSTAT